METYVAMGGELKDDVPKPSVDGSQGVQASSGERERAASGAAVESVAKRRRRVFGAAERLRIVREAEACRASGVRGSVGAVLRREGIYSSQLAAWQAQLGAAGVGGLAPKKSGRKPLPAGHAETLALRKRNAELERKLHVATALLALQKKAHELMTVLSEPGDGQC